MTAAIIDTSVHFKSNNSLRGVKAHPTVVGTAKRYHPRRGGFAEGEERGETE